MSSLEEQKEKSKLFCQYNHFFLIVKKILEDMFNIPFIQNYNERFSFLTEELDLVKDGLYNVQILSKEFC